MLKACLSICNGILVSEIFGICSANVFYLDYLLGVFFGRYTLNLARALFLKFIYGNQALLDEIILLIGDEVECDGDFNGFDIIALYL